MTRNTASRMLMTLTPALLVGAVAIALVGAGRAGEASAGENPSAPDVPAAEVSPACLTDDLTGTVTGLPRPARPGAREALLSLTNTSGRACRVQGWADIALVTAPGDLVRIPTRQVGQAAGGPGILLLPQASAWSRVEWDGCVPGRANCGVGVAWQYIVDPDSTGAVADTIGVPEADQDGVAMSAMRISPLSETRAAALS
ncbi:DUF4232 domain-containing protein [Actinoplanes sp. NEAU-A12]|uniref:DUF4232 domain-containing protein n=1 Tax=Actinoplanes sandaracinus TaxID=3045177 RepID=A0ABT6WIJ4_9ACTN|nr:DUF4232 domain-containing protein [Actinoplanes sandaracinus]MDI6099553.1 DUF4232 domain-containing protein [Actinoplanes sandaracinus]